MGFITAIQFGKEIWKLTERIDETMVAINSAMTYLAEQYTVNDMITENTRFLFLLESPHKNEVNYGVPVAGSSGIAMTKHLLGDAYGSLALGRLLLTNQQVEDSNPMLLRIGLMNSCPIPMQASAYEEEDQRKYDDFIALLEKIRGSMDKKRKGEQEQELLSIIVNMLRQRLLLWQDQSLVIVPCGRFAMAMWQLAKVSSAYWRVIEGVPHPSYGGFSQVRYQETVAIMKDCFSEVMQH